MSAPGFSKFAEAVMGGGSIWVVDKAGQVHAMSAEAYCSLNAAALRGSRVFTQEDGAREYAAEIAKGGATKPGR